MINVVLCRDHKHEKRKRVVGANEYEHHKVNRWTADVVDQLLTELTNLDKPFKYIVQAVCHSIRSIGIISRIFEQVIMQKSGAGLHTASSCFWDNTTDGSCTLR